jgi:hypothetical protein
MKVFIIRLGIFMLSNKRFIERINVKKLFCHPHAGSHKEMSSNLADQ